MACRECGRIEAAKPAIGHVLLAKNFAGRFDYGQFLHQNISEAMMAVSWKNWFVLAARREHAHQSWASPVRTDDELAFPQVDFRR